MFDALIAQSMSVKAYLGAAHDLHIHLAVNNLYSIQISIRMKIVNTAFEAKSLNFIPEFLFTGAVIRYKKENYGTLVKSACTL